MKAPLSWIREYVDLPADVTLSVLTDKLTMLGLKLEAITNPADAITGPLVLGRVLTLEKEPQKNGKTINWCTVDVSDANGTGEPQGIVCGAHNFVEGDLVVVCLPGAVLPGDFAISARKTYGHLSAGMICSAAELGLGTDSFNSGDGIIVLPADAGAPGDNAFDVLGMDDPVIEFEINPDRAYALSLRGIAREAALGFGLPFTDPGLRETPNADDRGYPVVVDDAQGCPVFVARTVSGFDPTAQTPAWMATRLEQAGKRHKLHSEASKRFERGVDPLLPQVVADRVVELLVELGGAAADPGVTVVGTAPVPASITIPVDLPARISGIEIAADTTVSHLTAVGCDVSVTGETLTAVAPSWRPDLTDPYDLVEEVVRIVGYDQVPSVLPTAPSGRGRSEAQRLRRRVGLTLAGAGLVETISYPFVGEADWDRLDLTADDDRRTALRVVNPLNNEEPLLTTTLLPGLLKALARNVGRGNGDAALFETSLVFVPTGDKRAPLLGVDRRPTDEEWASIEKAVPSQPLHLAIALTGHTEAAGWWGEGRNASWSDAIGTIRDLASELGVDLEVSSTTHEPWHPGRCAELRIGDRVIGHAGELHPRVCKAYGVPARSAVAEIDLDALLEHATGIVAGPRFSSYPVAKEDVALVVDASVPAAAVEAALREGAGELLESIRLFDVFTGDQVGEGKKSLAYALRFRAADRTLKEGEAAAARDAAVALAAERTGAVQR